MKLESDNIHLSDQWINGTLTDQRHHGDVQYFANRRLKREYRRLSSQAANLIINDGEIDLYREIARALNKPFDLDYTCEYILRLKVNRLEHVENELMRRIVQLPL